MATPSGEHYYQNEAFDKLFGKIGNNPVERIYMDKKIGEKVFSTVMSGKAYFDDVKMYSKEGKIVDIRLKAYPLKDKNDEITTLISFHENITEKKEQEERYHLLFETSNDAIFIMENDRFVECNEKAVKIFKATRDQIINSTPYDFSPEKQDDGSDSKEKAIAKINLALEGKSEVFEWTHITADGNLIYTEVSLNALEIGGKRLIQAIVRDITEKKRIEEELKNTNEELHEIIDAANLGTWIWNVQTNETIFNEIWARMFGYSLDEIHQNLKTWEDLTDPEDLKLAFEKLEKHFRGETEFYESEIRMKHKSGKWIWILDKGKVLSRTSDGKPLLMFGIHMDITKQKEIFFKVEESEKRYHAIMNNAADAIFIHDFSDNIIDVNEKACKMLQYNREELLKMKASDIDKTVNDKDHNIRHERIKKGEHVVLESFHIRKNGTLIPVEIHLSLIELDQVNYVLAIARDITERKMYEKSILEEQRKLSITLQSIGDGVIAVDIHGKITIINKMAQVLTEYSEQEALGKNIDDILFLVHENTNVRIINPIEKVLKSREKAELPLRTILISKTLKRYLISDSISPILDNEKKITGVVVVFRDITEKEKIIEQNLKAQKLESLGVISSGIAHDFNNLLAGIYSHINLALMQSVDQDVNNLLMESSKTIDRAKALTGQLLAFAKGGKPVLKVENVKSFLVDTVKFALAGSNIVPIFSIAEDTKMVLCDKNMINQIINNLVINARQAMNKGGKITIMCGNCFHKSFYDNNEKEMEYVCIKIIDEGEGIHPDKISKIFDPFYTTKADGHGLGLAISYTIARQHNGFLEVESEIDKGSTFSLYLPVAMKDDIDLFYETKKEKNEEKIASMEKNTKKVLILDDEISILKSSSKFLEKKGFVVETADNGDLAFKKFQESYDKNEPFDFLIFDLTIPGGMGGKEVIEKVRMIDKSVIAFVISGYSDDNIISEPEKYGFNEAIQKPYRLEDILTMIEKYLK
jgi:PAS domain S-box-containing protein